MEPKDFMITKIEGEYAYLEEIGKPENGEVFIALALLPMGVDIGTKLHFELFNYTIIE